MANQTITQLPDAGPITGTELVPIVQNGGTYKTTTAAITSSPNQTQTFITKNQEPTLANSRALSSGTGVGLVDGGAQSTLQVVLNGVSGSLETSSDGLIAKSGGTVVGRTLASSGAGLTVTDGDGASGNPTVALDGTVASLANNGGTGFLALPGNGTVSGRTLTSTPDQIDITNPNGIAGSPVFSIADNAVLPGSESVTIPAGDTASRPAAPLDGMLRYNTDLERFEAYTNGIWQVLGNGDGTVSSVVGTVNQITVVNATTTPQVSIATNPVIPGFGSITVPAGSTASRSASPVNGMFRYNSDTALFEGYLNGAWTSFASGSGVTSVSTGTGLTGGPITSTGTISIANTAVTAGAYGGADKTLSATVNAQGQLTALSEANIAIANTQVSGLGTMSTQNANGVAITGGTINATSVGATTPSTGAFTSVAMTSGTITTAPTSGNDIVNKTYADAIASGIHFHEAVELATTAALPANTYNNGTGGVGATLTANANGALSVDSTLTVVGNRILVKNEAAGANNGVYVVTQVGSAGTPYILTRATDFDSVGAGVDQIDEGDFFLVTSGTANVNTAWVQQTPPPITIGTTAIVFQQFSAPITYSPGTGLNESPAYTFNIANTAVTSGSYGSASSVGTFSVNAQGQLTAASDAAIAINGNQITSGVVGTANGGTGLSSFTANGVVYASSTSALTTGSALTFDGSAMVLNTSTANAALRITQTGTGNALLVEDSANPDASPFVVNSSGLVIRGHTSPITGSLFANLQTVGSDNSTSSIGQYAFSASNSGPGLEMGLSASGTIGTQTVVADGNGLGAIRFSGSDGTAFIRAAQIVGQVDGTPGTNDMPGRLVFSTTADGASSPTERMRIDSAGNVGIGTSSPGARLRVVGTSGNPQFGAGTAGNAVFINAFDSDTIYMTASASNANAFGFGTASNIPMFFMTNNSERMRITSAGDVGVGTSSPASKLDVNGTITATAYTGINGGTF
jgi:hypothetical protein